MASGLQQRLPNLLTLARLALALTFFVVLETYQYPTSSRWVLNIALGLFVLGTITDFLDGYLARRWGVTSTFGRVMDPLCDKVLVLGAFIYLAGSGFIVTGDVAGPTSVSGVSPWMVVVILTRELLVTGLRSVIESRGIAFGAVPAGKAKMVFQSVAIPVVLFLIANVDPMTHSWSAWVRDGVIYLTIAATVLSGIPYLSNAYTALSRANSASTDSQSRERQP